MPYLTVTGTGSWGFGRATGLPRVNGRGEPVLDAKGRPLPEVEMVTFEAGVHEVDEDVAERARHAGSPLLFVTDVQPIIVKRDPHGPLSLDDLRLPSDGGIYIQTEDGIEEAPTETVGPPLDWPCGVCTRKFPSEGARNRHREFNHAEGNL